MSSALQGAPYKQLMAIFFTAVSAAEALARDVPLAPSVRNSEDALLDKKVTE
jgi:hypothetical protein